MPIFTPTDLAEMRDAVEALEQPDEWWYDPSDWEPTEDRLVRDGAIAHTLDELEA